MIMPEPKGKLPAPSSVATRRRAICCLAAVIPLALAPARLGAQTLRLDYSTYLGGSEADGGCGIALGTGGEACVAGYTASLDFPTRNPYQSGFGGGAFPDYSDAFVYRLSSSGSGLAYSTYFGGSRSDYGSGIALGTDGDVYVVGHTDSSDFPTENPYQPSLATSGSSDVFASRIGSSGSALVYSTYLGGSAPDYGAGIALGTDGDAYIAGTTGSADFPTLNPYQACRAGTNNAFAVRLSSSGSALVFSTYLGGSGGYDTGMGIAVGWNGEACIVGATRSSDFPTANSYQASHGRPDQPYYPDAFASRLDSSGSSLVFSTYLGGSEADGGCGIALGTGGEVYVTGSTQSGDFPTLNPYQASFSGSAGTNDVFVSRLSSSGSSLLSSTYLGGSGGDDTGLGIAVGPEGDAYVAGDTWSPDFPTVNPCQAGRANPLHSDAFASRIGASGTSLVFSTCLGGSETDYGCAIALGTGGEAHIAGFTRSPDFPTENPYQANYGGGNDDAFVSKLRPVTPPLPTPTPRRLVFDAADFNGDGLADCGLWRASDGSWRIRGIGIVYYGLSTDIPVTGDYNGDGMADYAVWRPSTGRWWFRGATGPSANYFYGQNGDIPVPADYDGDFRTDTAIWRPLNGYWAIKSQTRFHYGASGDLPVPADYDGDGAAEYALYRPGYSSVWYIRNFTVYHWGLSGDTPAPGDFNGDGTIEISVYRPHYGRWYVPGSYVTFGQSGDIPVVFDWEGDGTCDRALYRPSEGRWYIYNVTSINYGTGADQPAVGVTY